MGDGLQLWLLSSHIHIGSNLIRVLNLRITVETALLHLLLLILIVQQSYRMWWLLDSVWMQKVLVVWSVHLGFVVALCLAYYLELLYLLLLGMCEFEL